MNHFGSKIVTDAFIILYSIFFASCMRAFFFFFFQAEDGIRDYKVTGVQTCALPISAAAARAKTAGFRTLVLTTSLEGEAREAARVFCSVVRGIGTRRTPIAPPACLLAGGETTVTVRGQGRGGRCQEFALSSGRVIAGWANTVVAAFGTDGTDGPTDAAGALVDGSTAARAQSAGLDAGRALADNDSYPFFQRLGDLLLTGPTRTNVNDIYLALVGDGSVRRKRARKRR